MSEERFDLLLASIGKGYTESLSADFFLEHCVHYSIVNANRVILKANP